jgi:hypothetical protein
MIHIEYLRQLKDNLDYIESSYIKYEMNIIYKIPAIKRKEIGEFNPYVILENKRLKWYLLEDLTIEISIGTINGIRKFIEYLEKNMHSDKNIKEVMMKYITEVGLA